MSAAIGRAARAVVITCSLALTATAAFAQQASATTPAQQGGHTVVETVKFLAGAGLGLTMHEGGHLVFDVIFDSDPRLSGVRFGPFPFFAIAHRSDLSPRREFTISSAGFWVQEATNEWLLTKRPHIRDEDAWVAKGVLAFNVLNSVGYALVAFAKAGPPQRDTLGMAAAIDVDERAIGAIVLAPALLDAYRYFRPEARWIRWTSRALKVGAVLLVAKSR